MKAQDVVNALAADIPLYTSAFSSPVAILSAIIVGTTVTVTTASPHGILENQNISILGMQAPVQIDIAASVRTGSIITIETLQDHDLTLSQRDRAAGGKTVTISGANEAEFTGSFSLLSVLNRRKIIVATTDAGPTVMTGAPLLEDAGSNRFNGFAVATNVTPTTFDYQLIATYPIAPIVTNASVIKDIRILSVLDVEQYLQDVHTKQLVDDFVLAVQLGNATISRSRNERTDASTSTAANAFLPTLIQTFSVFIISNTRQSLTGSEVRDQVETDLIPSVLRVIMRRSFDTGFSVNQYKATLVGHGVFAYNNPSTAKGKALYVHEIAFEQLCQLTGCDMAPPPQTVAMRDVDYALCINDGTGENLTADIDLDEEPIP